MYGPSDWTTFSRWAREMCSRPAITKAAFSLPRRRQVVNYMPGKTGAGMFLVPAGGPAINLRTRLKACMVTTQKRWFLIEFERYTIILHCPVVFLAWHKRTDLQSGVKLFQPSCENFHKYLRKWQIWQAVAACSCWQSCNRENSNRQE